MTMYVTQEVRIKLEDQRLRAVTGRLLSAAKLQDHNSFDKPDLIKPSLFKDAVIKNGELFVKLPPFSVVVLALK